MTTTEKIVRRRPLIFYHCHQILILQLCRTSYIDFVWRSISHSETQSQLHKTIAALIVRNQTMKKSIPPPSNSPMKHTIERAKLPPSEPPDPPPLIHQQPSNNNQTRTYGRDINAMVISNDRVEMIATPEMIYKVTRVVNHFIEHNIKYFASDEDDITPTSEWYLQWKTMYPVIKSSKRNTIK